MPGSDLADLTGLDICLFLFIFLTFLVFEMDVYEGLLWKQFSIFRGQYRELYNGRLYGEPIERTLPRKYPSPSQHKCIQELFSSISDVCFAAAYLGNPSRTIISAFVEVQLVLVARCGVPPPRPAFDHEVNIKVLFQQGVPRQEDAFDSSEADRIIDRNPLMLSLLFMLY